MVESVANLFLGILHDLLVEEAKSFLSVSGDVEQDLRIMYSLLMKADRDKRDSPSLKDCVAQLRDLALKAENVLETYAVKVAFNKEGQCLKKKLQRYLCIMCEGYSIHVIEKDTRKIISRLADLTRSLELEFGQESSSLSSEEDGRQHLYAREVEDCFIGMEKDIEILVSMVKDETRSQRVVKICGMGGIGKTTLARKIYNHADLQSYARAWVCISQHFQPEAVFGDILKQLESKELESKELQTGRNKQIDSMNVVDLMERIHRFLVQRKCLIVIDDIWQNDYWDMIKQAIPNNCSVLLTTRSEDIANRESQSYELGLLTVEQGWYLLQKIALPQDFDPVESLEDIGREIVVKCGRLPLAISAFGGILRQKEHTLAEWKRVNMNMDSYLLHGEGVIPDKRVKEVLDLSYDVLPYHLKPCFLYLACFPEDEEIETERLYLLWMAEGFISYQDKGHNETLRDVAERYLSELANRCMVQVHEAKGETYTPRHKFDSCRLHDLMYDLCSSKVQQENLVKRFDASEYQNDIRPSSGTSQSSRLAISLDSHRRSRLSIELLKELKDLRSFILLPKGGVSFQGIGFDNGTINFKRSQSLRILVLDNCDFEGDELPSKVGKLINLRYLSLRDSNVRELPQFVCGMPYLQTLDLRILHVIRLPNAIWKMKRLRHLFLSRNIEVIGGDKLRLDGLEELETLEKIESETACIADIPKLISLRTLSVNVNDIDGMTTFADHMSNNQSRLCETHLHVQSCDLSEDVFEQVLKSKSLVTLWVGRCNIRGGYPFYIRGMCKNLEHLTLSTVTVGGDVMEELGKYPMLRTLQLEAGEFWNTETLICGLNSFPQLKSLTLFDLRNLKKWEVEEGAMPRLTMLGIHGCRNLEKLPDGLRFISTIQQLKIYGMPKEFNDRVRGQDNATVSRIPSLNIRD